MEERDVRKKNGTMQEEEEEYEKEGREGRGKHTQESSCPPHCIL